MIWGIRAGQLQTYLRWNVERRCILAVAPSSSNSWSLVCISMELHTEISRDARNYLLAQLKNKPSWWLPVTQNVHFLFGDDPHEPADGTKHAHDIVHQRWWLLGLLISTSKYPLQIRMVSVCLRNVILWIVSFIAGYKNICNQAFSKQQTYLFTKKERINVLQLEVNVNSLAA